VKRREYRRENLAYLQLGPPLFHIGQKGVAYLLRQWKRFQATALPTNADFTVAPIDIAEFKLSNLTGAQPKPSQQEKHGPVAQFEGVVCTGIDHSFDILRGEESGN